MQNSRGEGACRARCLWCNGAEEFLSDHDLDVEGANAFIQYAPVASLLGVMPWNFPFYQVIRFATPNIMAGNTCLVKHASCVPQCAEAIENLFAESGFPEGVFTNLFIPSEFVEPIIKCDGIAGVSLTGSEEAGAAVAGLAGQNLKRSVLELGGNDAFIILDDADLEEVVEMAMKGRMVNNGQSCVASKRFIVLRKKGPEFLEAFADRVRAMKVGDPMAESTDLGPLSTEEAAVKLAADVQKSIAAGATVVCGGGWLDRKGAFYNPTILRDVKAGMPTYDLELFGPVATVYVVENDDEAMTKSHQKVVMKPGVYEVTDQMDRSWGFRMSGSHNEFDLTGVTIRTPISVLRSMSSRGRGDPVNYLIEGDHVILKGGTFENTYSDGRTEVTDSGSYNQDPKNAPARAMTEMKVTGDDVSLINCRMIVRGSSPYGYGNMYGIGGGAVVGLRKHSGILMTGDRNTIDGCQVKMEAFGHAIFVQGGEQVTVKNTEVEGTVRRSNELYEEKNNGDLPTKFGFKIQWPEELRGIAIPRDHIVNLVEDGIRAYPKTGHMTVENCKVSKCRGGIKLYMAKSATVSNCQVTDCVGQCYSLSSKGTITKSKGNAAYGPLLYIHSDATSSQKIDLEVLPAPHGLGDHPLAAIKGSRHSIRFISGGEGKELRRPIIVGYPLRFDFLSVDYPSVPKGLEERFARYAPKSERASGIKLENATKHPVVLGEYSQENEVTSRGVVRDLGTGNTVQTK